MLLYITDCDVSLASGPGVNEREFIAQLIMKRGESVRVIVPAPKNGLPQEIPETHVSFSLNHLNRNPALWIPYQIALACEIIKLIRSCSFKMIAMRFGLFPVTHYVLTRFLDTPYAVKHAGSGQFEVFERRSIVWRLLKPLHERIFFSLIRNASKVDVSSEAQKAMLLERAGCELDIISVGNVANTTRFKPMDGARAKERAGLNPDSFVLGYVGFHPFEKGGRQIIEVLPRLIAAGVNAAVLVVGDGERREDLEILSRRLGVADRCMFTGKVAYEEVPNYINALDIGVSLPGRNRHYWDATLKVRQYIACGKPVLVTPGSDDFVEVNGFGKVIEKDDVDAIYRYVLCYLGLTAIARSLMAKKARLYAERELSYEKMVERTLAHWEGCRENSEVKKVQV